jgi:hypothetical protein
LLRQLINDGISGKQAYRSGQIFKFNQKKAAEGDEKAQKRIVDQMKRNEGKTFFDVDGNELAPSDLLNKHFQLVAGKMTMTPHFTPTNEAELQEALSYIRSGICVSFVTDDAATPEPVLVEAPKTKKATRKPAFKNDPEPLA